MSQPLKSTNKNSLAQVLKLSLPMAITQLITMASGFLCMSMLARLGHDVLAASALIFSISIAILISFSSLFFSLSILIAHRFGEKNYLNIGILLQQSWILSFIISIPTLFIYWYIYPILIFFGQDKQLSLIAENYFHASIWRVVPFFLSVCSQQLCYGVHKQKIDMWANILGVFILLIFSYILIFGKLGFPKLGVSGFGYATSIQGIFYLLFTTVCFYFIPDFKKFALFRIHFPFLNYLKDSSQWQAIKQLFTIGWPISLQITGEMFSFMLVTTLIGWLGSHSLAAYQVVMQYQFLIVVPVFALSQASGILISQAYGSKNFENIKKIGTASLCIVSLISLFTGLIFLLSPKLLSQPYLNVNDPNNAVTLHLIILLFAVLAFSQFFDAIRNLLTGSLRGLLDTRYPMFVGLICIWLISLPLGYLFAFTFHLGAIGMSLGWLSGMLLSAIILFKRWQNKKRIQLVLTK